MTWQCGHCHHIPFLCGQNIIPQCIFSSYQECSLERTVIFVWVWSDLKLSAKFDHDDIVISKDQNPDSTDNVMQLLSLKFRRAKPHSWNMDLVFFKTWFNLIGRQILSSISFRKQWKGDRIVAWQHKGAGMSCLACMVLRNELVIMIKTHWTKLLL